MGKEAGRDVLKKMLRQQDPNFVPDKLVPHP
jgi:hypothetical protein